MCKLEKVWCEWFAKALKAAPEEEPGQPRTSRYWKESQRRYLEALQDEAAQGFESMEL